MPALWARRTDEMTAGCPCLPAVPVGVALLAAKDADTLTATRLLAGCQVADAFRQAVGSRDRRVDRRLRKQCHTAPRMHV